MTTTPTSTAAKAAHTIGAAPSAAREITAVTKPKKVPKPLTWTEFRRRYLRDKENDGFKYEWNNGAVEKSPYTMNVQQLYVWKNLNRRFQELKQQSALAGELVLETDTFLSEILHRRPDVAFFTDAQILDAVSNPIQVPAFVIEVISPSDTANRIHRKVREYFDAGVQVLWQIFPELEEVHIHTNATSTFIARGPALCSAEAVIPGFVLAAEAVFAH